MNASTPPVCRNCGAAAGGNFCSQCGQETRIALPTLGQFLGETTGRLLAIDGRLWRTLALLLGRPGQLTLEYLNGRRKHFVRPSRLFFALSVLLFAMLGLGSAPVAVSGDGSPAALVTIAAPVAAGTASAAQEQLADGCPALHLSERMDAWLQALPAPLRRELHPRLQHFRGLSAEDKARQLSNVLLRYGPYALFALLPVFAGLTQLAHYRHRRPHALRPQRYMAHLVYATHLHCAVFLAVMLALALPAGPWTLLLLPALLLHSALAQRRVYGGAWWSGLLRALAVGVAYAVCLLATLSLMLIGGMLLR